jgi:hypothetical protein
MSLPSTFTPAILDTVLGHLAGHFMGSTNNDLPTARHAASRMLAAYNAESEDELHLAADIVSFGFHALEALSEASAPELSLNNRLRLRGSAVSLSRESHKARRKLDQLQRARLTAAPQPEAQAAAATDNATTEQALGLIEFAREAIDASKKKTAWTPSRDQRRAAERITANLLRNKAEQERREAAKAAPIVAPHTEPAHQHAAM